MANRRPPNNNRRNDFQQRNDRSKNFGRGTVSPWQGGGPGAGIPNLLPLAGGSTEATLALASNIINLLQPRQNPVPSLLDMPIRRDFGPNVGRFDRGFNNNRMGNQNYRRSSNYNRAGDRMNTNRKNFRPNEGPKQQNKTTPKKEADSKAKPVKESNEEKKEETVTSDKMETSSEDQKAKKEAPKTRYDDINPQLLKCHICNKSMWDGRSFENHLTGRAHAIMMQKTAESYALTADTMRQEFKIREMIRTRKQGGGPVSREFYCAMCDMYAAEGSAHRTTVGHRKLKKYLHPSCAFCRKEMPTRIELDEHRLSAEHLRHMQDKQDTITKPKPEVMIISTLSMEQSYVRDGQQRRRKHQEDGRDREESTNEDMDSETKVKQEGEEAETADKQEPEAEAPVDNEDTILDYVEGEDIGPITTERLPAYNTERGVGASFLTEFRYVQCKLCRKLLESDEAAQVHLRTWRHHQLFTRMLAEKASKKQKQESSQDEGGSETPETQQSQKRPLNCEESGNWKRRKTTPDPDTEDAETREDEEVNVKEEKPDNNGSQSQSENVDDADQEMPHVDDLEDWNQQGQEEQRNEENGEEQESSVKEESVEEKSKEAEKAAAPTPAPAAAPAPKAAARSPRGSPRGRGRGRGRRY